MKCLYCFLVGGLRRWYNPPWYNEQVPSTPYDPLVLRNAFEKVCLEIYSLQNVQSCCNGYCSC